VRLPLSTPLLPKRCQPIADARATPDDTHRSLTALMTTLCRVRHPQVPKLDSRLANAGRSGEQGAGRDYTHSNAMMVSDARKQKIVDDRRTPHDTAPSQERRGEESLRMASKPLIGLAIERASAAVAAGDSAEAWEWLSSISPADRPVALAASCLDMLSRSAADSGDWSEALRAAVDANHVAPMSARQARAALLRRRAALLADGAWTTIREAVEPAHLDPAAMRPRSNSCTRAAPTTHAAEDRWRPGPDTSG
jgi:hypothetical protein